MFLVLCGRSETSSSVNLLSLSPCFIMWCQTTSDPISYTSPLSPSVPESLLKCLIHYTDFLRINRVRIFPYSPFFISIESPNLKTYSDYTSYLFRPSNPNDLKSPVLPSINLYFHLFLKTPVYLCESEIRRPSPRPPSRVVPSLY